MRELGIPSVLDRFIQQALLQTLQPCIDPNFSRHSYGFRPGRRAHEAILAAQAYIQAGRRWVVDVDLEQFFDRVNHDVLMGKLAGQIADRRVLGLIRRYLEAGILAHGIVMERHEGTPQGGPSRRCWRTCFWMRWIRSWSEAAMPSCATPTTAMCTCARAVPESGSCGGCKGCTASFGYASTSPRVPSHRITGRKFLGYTFWVAPGGVVKRAVARKPLSEMKARVRRITARNAGRSIEQVSEELRRYLVGWREYFRLAQTPGVFSELDQWLRHRLRALHLKHWRHGHVIYRELRARGMSQDHAAIVAGNSRRWWHNSSRLLNRALPNRYFDQLGILGWPRDLNSSNRPVRTRMPGGVAGAAQLSLRAPMPIVWKRNAPLSR